MNYSLYDYAFVILSSIQHLCREAHLPEPNIITESGRALTAHHAVLITNIIDIDQGYEEMPLPINQDNTAPVVLEMWQHFQSLPTCTPAEVSSAAYELLIRAQNNFLHGKISLQDKATIESLFKKICLEIYNNPDASDAIYRSFYDQLSEKPVTKIVCNLSFFQSIPDAWALNQVFPVAPISQLLNTAYMPSILGDLTCDSDGTLNRYLSGGRAIRLLLCQNLINTCLII